MRKEDTYTLLGTLSLVIVFPKVCIALLFSSLQIYRFLIK